jgi:putative sterol carrier protein
MKDFYEYLEDRTINKITPDINRSIYLSEEAKKRHRFLKEMTEKIKLSDDNANYVIEMSYDILLELIRSKMLKDGYCSSGSHEAEISYMKI